MTSILLISKVGWVTVTAASEPCHVVVWHVSSLLLSSSKLLVVRSHEVHLDVRSDVEQAARDIVHAWKPAQHVRKVTENSLHARIKTWYVLHAGELLHKVLRELRLLLLLLLLVMMMRLLLVMRLVVSVTMTEVMMVPLIVVSVLLLLIVCMTLMMMVMLVVAMSLLLLLLLVCLRLVVDNLSIWPNGDTCRGGV